MMDPLVRSLLASLPRAGDEEHARQLLARAGEPDPARATADLRRAAAHPDLHGSREQWVPGALLTARPGFAALCLEELATRYRDTRRRPLDPDRFPWLVRVLGSSDFLARLLLRHPHWVEEIEGDPPGPPADALPEPDWTAIRIAKYRGLLRIAARDLSGRDPEAGLRELSDLADRCLRAALECAARQTGTAPPALFGLGKLGGRELNFSSDVDLLFLHDGASSGTEEIARSQEATRLIQVLKTNLEVPGEDGFGYRVDLDLRPEGRQGVLANSVEAALGYYESFGAEWERQVLLRLRHVAGPESTARSFTTQIEPFVYRRLIDPGAIEQVRAMKRRIEAERRSSGRDLESDLKEGPGGIRDVEFLVQALQLLLGGRHPELRGGTVAETLRTFTRLGLLPADASEQLCAAYLWLRRAEHCVQLVEERQTHGFPRDPAGRLALARRMGYGSLEGEQAREQLECDWARVRTQIREQFESLVLEPGGEHVFRARAQRLLRDTPLLPCLEPRAAPFLEKRGRDDAILELEGPVLRGLARVLASQPESARYLSHRPALLERIAKAGPRSLEERARALAREPVPAFADDLEAFLDWLRITRRDDTILAACLDLGGLVSFEEASGFHSRLAEACIRWTLEVAERKLGVAPGRGLSVLGMGKVAGRELTYHSDLDLIFLFPGEAGNVTGPSRAAQKLIHYLTTMTGAGVAYTVDSRLRPSGRQGALVSTFTAYERYQCRQAATWEHMALMRARAVAGSVARAQQVLDRTRAAVLARRIHPWPEIRELRGRVEQERGREGVAAVAFKAGAGGLMDVEFLAAGACLERGLAIPAGVPSTAAMLRRAAPGPRVEDLLAAYRFLRIVEARARWVAGRAVEILDPSREETDVVAELIEPGLDTRTLGKRLERTRGTIRDAFRTVVEAGSIEALA